MRLPTKTKTHFLKNFPFAFAYHKIILDEKGQPIDYKFLEVNAAFEQLTGLKAEAIIGKTARETLSGIENSAFNWIGVYGKVALEGGNQAIEQYSEPLGKWYQVQAWSDKKGFFATLFVDITEQRQTAEKLRIKEDHAHAVFERITDGVVAFDNEMNYTFINARGGELLRCKPEDLIGKNYWQEYPEAKETPFARAYARALATQEKVIFEEYYAPWQRWFENRVFPTTDGISVFFTDTTKRKQAEIAVKQREAILSAVAFTSERLLKGTNWQEEIDLILASLGQASEASRCYIFQAHPSETGETLVSHRFEWCASHIAPQIANPDLQHLSLQTIGFGRWQETLSRGTFISGDIQTFPETERELLAVQDIRSLVVIPIFVQEQWWGFIGFDQCESERIWSTIEVDALGTAGNIIGLAIGRQQAEQTFKAEHANRLSILENTADLICLRDREHRVLAFNTQWGNMVEKLFGTRPAIGMNTFDLLPVEQQRYWQPILASVLDGTTYQGEFQWGFSEDDTRYYEIAFFPIEQEGQTIGYTEFNRDITARKQAEISLRKSEEKFRKAFLTSPDSININRLADGLYLEVNDGFLHLTGYEREQVIGRTSVELNIWDNLHDREQLVERLQTDGFVENLTASFRCKDDTLCYGLMSACVIELHGETCILSITRDITKQKEAEETLRLQSAALEAAANAIAITDRNGIVQWANPAYSRLTGYTVPEIVGNRINLLYSGQQNSAFYKQLWQTIQAGKVWQGELVNKRKDGTLYTEQMTITPVSMTDGEITHFVAVKEDISERLAREKVERHRQRLESLGVLAGGVAHDLNNSLTPTMLYLGFLKTQYPNDTDAIDVIATSIKRAAGMVRQLLNFAKGAEGEHLLIQPNHLLKEVQAMMNSTFPKNIRVEVIHGKTVPAVLGDATQLHQVLLNLCVNARDAMPQGGHLTLEATPQEVADLDPISVPNAKLGRYVRIRVKDTGVGMPTEVMERIFDPFYSTKTADKGTGLGLSTVIGIVKGHGGFVLVDSEPGNGAVFDVHLPAAEKDNEMAVSLGEAARQFRGDGQTILLVEDEAAIRQIVASTLNKLNFTPILAHNGVEGLLKVNEHASNVQAVITDLDMPQMDGLTFIRLLRQTMPDIPVILITGYMAEDVLAEIQSLARLICLEKPFTAEELANVLQAVLDDSA